MKCSVSRFLGIALTGCLAAAGLSLLSASDVSAASYPSEVLLGTFWESDNNTTDTVYWSTDGVNFYELSEAYTDATPNDPSTSWIAGTPYNLHSMTRVSFTRLAISICYLASHRTTVSFR